MFMLVIYLRCPFYNLWFGPLGGILVDFIYLGFCLWNWVVLGSDILSLVFTQRKQKGRFDPSSCPSVNLSPVSFLSPFMCFCW